MPQHPLFKKYTREYLHEVTGFSKGYLSRIATGRIPISSSFIERVCFKFRKPESELFLPIATEVPPTEVPPTEVPKPKRRHKKE